jgi:hypothetical protein
VNDGHRGRAVFEDELTSFAGTAGNLGHLVSQYGEEISRETLALDELVLGRFGGHWHGR